MVDGGLLGAGEINYLAKMMVVTAIVSGIGLYSTRLAGFGLLGVWMSLKVSANPK